MPEICRFLGIIIRMFYNDHAPPHFHAFYGEFKAVIDISTNQLIEGKMPKAQLQKIESWCKIHQIELLENWERIRAYQKPNAIKPYEIE